MKLFSKKYHGLRTWHWHCKLHFLIGTYRVWEKSSSNVNQKEGRMDELLLTPAPPGGETQLPYTSPHGGQVAHSGSHLLA